MPRLVVLTPAELTRDPRARRAVAAAVASGWEVFGVCPSIGGAPVALDGIHVVRTGGEALSPALRAVGLGAGRKDRAFVRELRGVYRQLRLAQLTFALWRAGRRIGRADVVHANDVDTLPAGTLLARALDARLVYDAHELYTMQEADPPRLHRALLRRLERALARHAAAVITVNESLSTELQRMLGLPRRPLVVLNCPSVTPRAAAPRVGAPLRAVYQGAVGLGRSLDDLLDAASSADGVELTLRVVGVDAGELASEVRRRSLDDRVAIREPVDPRELVEALTEFDVGVIATRPLTLNDELAAPNKLFEYLMAGLAIAAPNLPGIQAMIGDADVGIMFEPGSASALGEALRTLAGRPREVAEQKRRARELALTRFNAETQRPALAEAWRA